MYIYNLPLQSLCQVYNLASHAAYIAYDNVFHDYTLKSASNDFRETFHGNLINLQKSFEKNSPKKYCFIRHIV